MISQNQKVKMALKTLFIVLAEQPEVAEKVKLLHFLHGKIVVMLVTWWVCCNALNKKYPLNYKPW